MINFISAADLINNPNYDKPDTTRWGNWRLDPTNRVLVHTPEHYAIDLDKCLTSAQVLDWIMQVASKDWGATAVTGLIHALNDTLDPQATLCSFGQSKQLTRANITRLVNNAAKWAPPISPTAHRPMDQCVTAEPHGDGNRHATKR